MIITYVKSMNGRILAPIAITLFVSVALFIFQIQSETNRIRSDIAIYAENIHNYIDDRTRLYETVLEGFSSYLSAEQGLKIDKAREYVRNLRKQYPDIYMMEISRRITDDERNAFEKEMQEAGHPDFNIHVFDYEDNRKFKPSKSRDIYYPIVFMEPELPESKGVLGLDLADTSSILNSALHRSSKLGTQVASMPFNLIENKSGYILYRPVSRLEAKKESINKTSLTATYYALLVVNTSALLSDEMKNRKGISISISTLEPDSGDKVDVLTVANKNNRLVLSEILPSFNFAFTNETASQPFQIKVNYDVDWEDINFSIIISSLVTVLLTFVITFWLSNIIYRREIEIIENSNASLRKVMEGEIQSSEQHLKLYREQAPMATIEWNPDFQVVDWNKAAETMFGYTLEEVKGRNFVDIMLPDTVIVDIKKLWKDLMAQTGGEISVNENITKDGDIILCEWHNTPIIDELGNVIGAASIVQDITKRKEIEIGLEKANKELAFQNEEKQKRADELVLANEEINKANHKLEQLSRTDALTNIANRRYFDETLEAETRRQSRQGTPLTLMICDIDCFKQYNDSYGHQMGDVCLQQVAESIDSSFPRVGGDLVARYGGEEFAVILPNIDKTNALILAERIRENIVKLALEHNSSLIASIVTLSIGVTTLVPDKDTSISIIIKNADEALYSAKAAGRNNVQYSS